MSSRAQTPGRDTGLVMLYNIWKRLSREVILFFAFFLSPERKRALERRLRGKEEFRKLGLADVVVVSFGKSGRTWVRVLLSRFFQLRFGLRPSAFIGFDNLHRKNDGIPRVFFTHDNYLRDFTGHQDSKADFYDKKVVLLVRQPGDVAVSQFHQWKFRMRPHKKGLNKYPEHGREVDVFSFATDEDAGLPKVKPLENIVPTITGADLTFSHGCPVQLKEGEECFLSVYYQPTAAGTLTGELRVTSNAGALALPLSGTAVAALDPAAGVVAFTGSVDGNFGTVARGGTKTLTYVVQNIGNAADAITVTGPTGSGWSFSEDCPDTLAVGSSCNVSISFAPSVSGNSVPTPLVISDAYNGSYGGLSLALTGSGS